jgi:hypothetical protein
MHAHHANLSRGANGFSPCFCITILVASTIVHCFIQSITEIDDFNHRMLTDMLRGLFPLPSHRVIHVGMMTCDGASDQVKQLDFPVCVID